MSKKKILVVDDEKNIRTMIRNCLDEKEYEIDIAVNGEEGFTKLNENDYDITLLDIKMPGITGLELLKKLRDNEIYVDVVMMTAYGTVERAVEAMKLGAIDFISKPFTPAEIRDIVETVIGRKQLEESNVESFKDTVEFAKSCILSQEYDKATEYLKKAVGMEVDSPEPHNLLGVLSEMNGDKMKAQNHYRAALALDPTYESASKNLSRVVIDGNNNKKIDLGGTRIKKTERNNGK